MLPFLERYAELRKQLAEAKNKALLPIALPGQTYNTFLADKITEGLRDQRRLKSVIGWWGLLVLGVYDVFEKRRLRKIAREEAIWPKSIVPEHERRRDY